MKKINRLLIFIFSLILLSGIFLPDMKYSYCANAVVIKPKTEVQKVSESKKVLGKFFKSMMLVGASCIFLFLILLLYKKLKSSSVTGGNSVSLEKNLTTPETVEDSIKFVIEKF